MRDECNIQREPDNRKMPWKGARAAGRHLQCCPRAWPASSLIQARKPIERTVLSCILMEED